MVLINQSPYKNIIPFSRSAQIKKSLCIKFPAPLYLYHDVSFPSLSQISGVSREKLFEIKAVLPFVILNSSIPLSYCY